MCEVTFKLFQHLCKHRNKRLAAQIVCSFMLESKLLQGTEADRKVQSGREGKRGGREKDLLK